MDRSEDVSFDDKAWISVLESMEDSYVQSLQYQTEVEEKNEALDQANQFISGVVSTMSDALIVTNEELEITQVNAAFLKMASYEEQEVIGKPIDAFITIKSSGFSNGFMESKAYQDVLVDLHGRYNVTPLTISCSCAQVCLSSFKGRVLVGRPVSEVLQAYDALQKAYQELRETQEKMLHTERMASLGRLVAGVAHELNTPISVLQGNLWLLSNHLHADVLSCIERGGMGDEQALEMIKDLPELLDDCQGAAKQIGYIVKELKQFSHQDDQDPQSFSITHAIETASDWALGNALNAQICFQLDVEQELHIVGSASKFQQVMINLIQNAIDAVHHTPNPKIKIKAYRKETRMTVLVEDNGCGIPVALMDKIFDYFFTTKEEGKGTGLGLSISYQLLQEMEGTLTAWNKVEGGAAFQIQFDLEGGE